MNSNQLSVIGKRFTIHHSPFTIHHFLPTVYCLLITVYCLSLSGCIQQNDTWQRLQDGRTPLRVGVDPTYPPFAVADSSDVWGLDIDLARAISEELGVPVQFTYFGFDGLYDALLTEQVDVLISALVVDVGRTGDFAYSDPYFNAGEVLVVRADGSEVGGWRDLNGRTLAVELGSQGHMEA
ncbi:MAG: amino acid ABC transporter substrate-binding protein, partial [Anaerolineales bacterium]|nr:amino acid ABC transporter substrate-binding protein [Anaerolineales bacterium]